MLVDVLCLLYVVVVECYVYVGFDLCCCLMCYFDVPFVCDAVVVSACYDYLFVGVCVVVFLFFCC